MRDGSSIAATKARAVSGRRRGLSLARGRPPRPSSCASCLSGDRRHHGSPSRNQTSHGGGKTRDPFACFESLVDKGSGESPREPDSEHDRQTSDRELAVWFAIVRCELGEELVAGNSG